MPKFQITYEVIDAENWGDYWIEKVEADSITQAIDKFRKEHRKYAEQGERHEVTKVEEIKNNN